MADDAVALPEDIENRGSLPLIYVLGNSHSGSTLLGFLLAANPGNVYLGELKIKTWEKDRFCSCGESPEECAFYKNYFTTYNALKEKAIRNIMDVNPLQFYFKKNIQLDATTCADLRKFYLSVVSQTNRLFPNTQFLVDTSKSIWLLNAWLNILPAKQVKIIFLRREPKAIMASFLKRKKPFWNSLMRILVNDFLIRRYLKRNRLLHHNVDFGKLYSGYAEEARKLSDFLGVPIPSDTIAPVHHHAISGNRYTRTSFVHQIPEFRKDEDWKKILSPIQKQIIKLLS